jgi:nicotinate phosphoribosyltransferase
MAGDCIGVVGEAQPGEPLLRPVMRAGGRIATPSIDESRAQAAADLARLPEPLARLEPGANYRVEVSAALRRLADEVDARLAEEDA